VEIDANRGRASKETGGVAGKYPAAQNAQERRNDNSRKLPIRSLPVVFGHSHARERPAPTSRLVHRNADPVAGDTRLGHFEQTGPDPVAIANAHLVVGEALDGEVLAELPKGEVASPEPILPIAIGGNLIGAPTKGVNYFLSRIFKDP
jgi:hypothetical protein